MVLVLRPHDLRVYVTVLLCRLLSTDCWQYGMVMDAGSGGTRLHAFRWPDRLSDPLHPQYPAVTIPEELFAVRVTPGISAFAGNVTGLRPYIHMLISRAQKNLMFIRELWSIIPVYLKATAGARDLFQDQRDLIFARLRALLYECPFRFDTNYWARTISGEEEGVYSWLAVNAIKGTYRTNSVEDTWGSLDIGGSSAQVAFIPHDVSIIQNYFPLHLSYLSFHLYAHSYLEFGYRDANERLVRRYLQRGSAGTKGDPVIHPCFPAGKRFRQALREPFVVGQESIWIVGKGDFDECMELAVSLLDLNKTCFVPGRSRRFSIDPSSAGACAIAGTYEPRLYSQKFVATGQYSMIVQAMGLPTDRVFPLGEMLTGARRLCAAEPGAVELEEVHDPPKTLNGGKFVDSKVLKDPMGMAISRCWKAVWFWTVLHRGFRFPADSRQIIFADTLNGRETGWALGSMAYDVNYYPWQGAAVQMPVRGVEVAASEAAASSRPTERLPAGTGYGAVTLVGVAIACLTAGVALGVFWGRQTRARWCGADYLAMVA